MGTRMTRFRGRQLAPEVLRTLVGQQLEVFLRDGQTITAELIGIQDGVLELQNTNRQWYNTRYHTHRVALVEVVEMMTTQQEAF